MKKFRSTIHIPCVSVPLVTRWPQADSHPQLDELSSKSMHCHRMGCVIATYLGQYEIFHLRIRVPADDQANGSWGAFAQDGVDFAQSSMADVDRVHFQDLISAAQIALHLGH